MKRIAFVLPLLALLAAAQEPEAPQVLRIYDLGDLSPAAARTEGHTGIAECGFELLGPSNGSTDGMPIEWVRLPEQEPETRRDLVVELFNTFAPGIDMGYWEVAGGTKFLVRTSEAGHQTMSRILDLLRAPGTPGVEMELRHYSIDARGLDDGARAALAAAEEGTLEADHLASLARFDARGGRRGGVLHASLGRWSCLRAARELRYLPDYDVEIAQGSAVADPVPRLVTEGVMAAIRPLPMQDGRMLLRIVASAGRIDGSFRSFDLAAREQLDSLRIRNTDFGTIEQCDYQGGAVSADAVVTPGRTCAIVLASPAAGVTRFEVIAITLRSAPEAAASDTFVVAPIGALVAADCARTLSWDENFGELHLLPAAEESAFIDTGTLIECLGIPAAHPDGSGFLYRDETLYGGSILLRADEKEARAALEKLKEVERTLLRPAWLDVRFAVESQGRDALTVGVLAVPLVAGRRVAAAAYRRMDTVGDYDVEVAQEARIADPLPRGATLGVFANALLLAGAEGAHRLQIDLQAAGAPDGIRTIPPGAGGVPALQSVAIRRRLERLQLDLSPGRPKAVDLGSNPFEANEEGRLVVTITVQTR